MNIAIRGLPALLLFCFSVGAMAPALSADAPVRATKILSATSTPLSKGHPLFLMAGERIQFANEQRYSKWSVLFEESVKIDQVEVEACADSKGFEDGVELYVDFNQKRLFADGGRKKVQFKPKMSVQTLTLNFLESASVCISGLKIVVGSGAGEILKPQMLHAKGDVELADGAIAFSGRARAGSAAAAKATATAKSKTTPLASTKWTLKWDQPLIIENLRLWNGNQGPGENFTSKPRVREIEVRTETGKPTTAVVEDRRYEQIVVLKEGTLSKSIQLKSLSSYPPANAAVGDGTVGLISEVQFQAGGETWFPVIEGLVESPDVKPVRAAGYGDILDRELRSDDRDDIWRFRIRSDGTFFARVFLDRPGDSRAWSVLGSWTLKSAPKAKSEKGINLQLTGIQYASAEILDSIPCANRCFKSSEDRGPANLGGAREIALFDQIEIQRRGRQLFFVRNRSSQKTTTLDFRDLNVRLHSLFD